MSLLSSDLLDPLEAAKYSGLSANTIRVYAKKGKLRHVRIGSRYFFKKEDLNNLLTIIEPHVNENPNELI